MTSLSPFPSKWELPRLDLLYNPLSLSKDESIPPVPTGIVFCKPTGCPYGDTRHFPFRIHDSSMTLCLDRLLTPTIPTVVVRHLRAIFGSEPFERPFSESPVPFTSKRGKWTATAQGGWENDVPLGDLDNPLHWFLAIDSIPTDGGVSAEERKSILRLLFSQNDRVSPFLKACLVILQNTLHDTSFMHRPSLDALSFFLEEESEFLDKDNAFFYSRLISIQPGTSRAILKGDTLQHWSESRFQAAWHSFEESKAVSDWTFEHTTVSGRPVHTCLGTHKARSKGCSESTLVFVIQRYGKSKSHPFVEYFSALQKRKLIKKNLLK